MSNKRWPLFGFVMWENRIKIEIEKKNVDNGKFGIISKAKSKMYIIDL